jgi:hypothetical protein
MSEAPSLKQTEILGKIRQFIEEKGHSPIVAELATLADVNGTPFRAASTLLIARA